MPEYKCFVNIYTLPMVGFGEIYQWSREFSNLVKGNRFLFRVQDRRSKVKQLVDDGFLAAAFRYPPDPPIDRPSFDYESVMEHIRWDSRVRTPYISASFSFAWAIWEANRRVRNNNRDVCIAVIDGTKIRSNTAEVALGILEECGATASSRNFASASQEVLIYAHIPADAVISISPLEDILEELPPWIEDLTIWDAPYTTFCEREARRRRRTDLETRGMAKYALELAQSTLPNMPSRTWGKFAFGLAKHYIVWTMEPSQSPEEMDITRRTLGKLGSLVRAEVRRRRYAERYRDSDSSSD